MFSLSACTDRRQTVNLEGPEFTTGGHQLVADIGRLPYRYTTEQAIEPNRTDYRGLHFYERNDQRYFHPVGQAQLALSMHNNWKVKGDDAYLEHCELNGEDILENATEHDGALWLPYGFDFPLHGDPENTIHADWWSGMAQGQVLSLMCRLAGDTGDRKWRNAADSIFESFLRIHSFDSVPADHPWTVFVDANGYLWFEEYAGDVEPMRVLNGHIFALYGLYDYWALTGDNRAARLFDGGAETVLEYVPQLRVPGEPSWYGMRIQDNPVAQSEGYHRIHIGQLSMLALMTGDDRFEDLSEQLSDDFS